MTTEQIEIERKKFEKQTLSIDGYEPYMLNRDVNGDYIDEKICIKFAGWLACCESRESVCVVVPKKKRIVTNSQASYNRAIDDFVFLLQSSGLSYREEE